MTQEEFKTLYNTYYFSLCGFASSILPENEAHDVVIDCLLNAHKSKGFDYRHSHAKTFLFNSVKYKCIDTLRRTKHYRTIVKELAEENNYYEIPIDRYTIKWVMRVINTLPEMQKRVLMHSINDLSNKEIGNILGIAERTVINHKHVAIKNLKSKLCLQ